MVCIEARAKAGRYPCRSEEDSDEVHCTMRMLMPAVSIIQKHHQRNGELQNGRDVPGDRASCKCGAESSAFFVVEDESAQRPLGRRLSNTITFAR